MLRKNLSAPWQGSNLRHSDYKKYLFLFLKSFTSLRVNISQSWLELWALFTSGNLNPSGKVGQLQHEPSLMALPPWVSYSPVVKPLNLSSEGRRFDSAREHSNFFLNILRLPGSRLVLTTRGICSWLSLLQLLGCTLNSQLVCLQPVGIFNSCCWYCVLSFCWLYFIGSKKPLWGVVNYVLYCIVLCHGQK